MLFTYLPWIFYINSYTRNLFHPVFVLLYQDRLEACPCRWFQTLLFNSYTLSKTHLLLRCKSTEAVFPVVICVLRALLVVLLDFSTFNLDAIYILWCLSSFFYNLNLSLVLEAQSKFIFWTVISICLFLIFMLCSVIHQKTFCS